MALPPIKKISNINQRLANNKPIQNINYILAESTYPEKIMKEKLNPTKIREDMTPQEKAELMFRNSDRNPFDLFKNFKKDMEDNYNYKLNTGQILPTSEEDFYDPERDKSTTPNPFDMTNPIHKPRKEDYNLIPKTNNLIPNPWASSTGFEYIPKRTIENTQIKPQQDKGFFDKIITSSSGGKAVIKPLYDTFKFIGETVMLPITGTVATIEAYRTGDTIKNSYRKIMGNDLSEEDYKKLSSINKMIYNFENSMNLSYNDPKFKNEAELGYMLDSVATIILSEGLGSTVVKSAKGAQISKAIPKYTESAMINILKAKQKTVTSAYNYVMGKPIIKYSDDFFKSTYKTKIDSVAKMIDTAYKRAVPSTILAVIHGGAQNESIEDIAKRIVQYNLFEIGGMLAFKNIAKDFRDAKFNQSESFRMMQNEGLIPKGMNVESFINSLNVMKSVKEVAPKVKELVNQFNKGQISPSKFISEVNKIAKNTYSDVASASPFKGLSKVEEAINIGKGNIKPIKDYKFFVNKFVKDGEVKLSEAITNRELNTLKQMLDDGKINQGNFKKSNYKLFDTFKTTVNDEWNKRFNFSQTSTVSNIINNTETQIKNNINAANEVVKNISDSPMNQANTFESNISSNVDNVSQSQQAQNIQQADVQTNITSQSTQQNYPDPYGKMRDRSVVTNFKDTEMGTRPEIADEISNVANQTQSRTDEQLFREAEEILKNPTLKQEVLSRPAKNDIEIMAQIKNLQNSIENKSQSVANSNKDLAKATSKSNMDDIDTVVESITKAYGQDNADLMLDIASRTDIPIAEQLEKIADLGTNAGRIVRALGFLYKDPVTGANMRLAKALKNIKAKAKSTKDTPTGAEKDKEKEFAKKNKERAVKEVKKRKQIDEKTKENVATKIEKEILEGKADSIAVEANKPKQISGKPVFKTQDDINFKQKKNPLFRTSDDIERRSFGEYGTKEIPPEEKLATKIKDTIANSFKTKSKKELEAVEVIIKELVEKFKEKMPPSMKNETFDGLKGVKKFAQLIKNESSMPSIWEEAREIALKKYADDAVIVDYLELMKPTITVGASISEGTAKKALSEILKAKDINIGDLVKKYYRLGNKAEADIKSTLIKVGKLNEEQAKRAYKYIKTRYDEIIDDEIIKGRERAYKALEDKPKTTSEQKISNAIDKLEEYSNLSLFNGTVDKTIATKVKTIISNMDMKFSEIAKLPKFEIISEKKKLLKSIMNNFVENGKVIIKPNDEVYLREFINKFFDDSLRNAKISTVKKLSKTHSQDKVVKPVAYKPDSYTQKMKDILISGKDDEVVKFFNEQNMKVTLDQVHYDKVDELYKPLEKLKKGTAEYNEAKKLADARLTTYIEKITPTDIYEKAVAYQITNLLLGVKLWLKNIAQLTESTIAETATTKVATGFDKIFAKFNEGQRTRFSKTFDYAESYKEFLSGFKDAMNGLSYDDFRKLSFKEKIEALGNPTNTSKYDMHPDMMEEIGKNSGVYKPIGMKFKNKYMRVAENIAKQGVGGPVDRAFYAGHYSMAERQIKEFYKVNKLTKEMEESVRLIAQMATLRDMNAVTKLTTTLQNFAKNSTNPLVKAFDVFWRTSILPFAKVPANSHVRKLEYSPLGFLEALTIMGQNRFKNGSWIKGMSMAEQAKLATVLGRATVGSGVMFFVAYPAKNLFVSDDMKSGESRLRSADNTPRFGVKIGDTYLDISWADHLIGPAQYAIDLKKIWNSDNNSAIKLAKSVSAPFERIFTDGLLRNVNDMFDSPEKDVSVTDKVGRKLLGMPANYVPSPISAISSAFDSSDRSVESDNPIEKFGINPLMKKTPLRFMLPENIGVDGEVKPNKGILKSTFDFMNISSPTKNEVKTELYRLSDVFRSDASNKNRQDTFMPDKLLLSQSISLGGNTEKVQLSMKEKNDLQKEYSKKLFEAYDNFINDRPIFKSEDGEEARMEDEDGNPIRYSELLDESKIKIMNEINNNIRNQVVDMYVKEKLLKQKGININDLENLGE